MLGAEARPGPRVRVLGDTVATDGAGPRRAVGRRLRGGCPGSPSRLSLAAAEIFRLSLLRKLAAGLLMRPSVHLRLLSSLSNVDTWAVGSSGGSGLWFWEPDLLLPSASFG